LRAGTVIPLLALVLCVLTLGAFEPRVRSMPENSWMEVLMSPAAPNSLRVSIGLAVVLALAALWRLIRPGRVQWVPWGGDGRQRYAALEAGAAAGAVAGAAGAAAGAHGAASGAGGLAADGLVLGELGRAGIPFRRIGRVMLGLGDPAGAATDRVSAIWNLRDLAQQEGLDPAVWRAGPELLKVYEDLGLAALPLGMDGLPLPEREGDAPVVRDYLCCVAERDLSLLLPLLPTLAGETGLQAAD